MKLRIRRGCLLLFLLVLGIGLHETLRLRTPEQTPLESRLGGRLNREFLSLAAALTWLGTEYYLHTQPDRNLLQRELLPLLRATLLFDPRFVPAAAQLAHELSQRNDPRARAEAIRILRSSLATQPDHPRRAELWGQLAMIQLFGAGQTAEAMISLQRAMDSFTAECDAEDLRIQLRLLRRLRREEGLAADPRLEALAELFDRPVGDQTPPPQADHHHHHHGEDGEHCRICGHHHDHDPFLPPRERRDWPEFRRLSYSLGAVSLGLLCFARIRRGRSVQKFGSRRERISR